MTQKPGFYAMTDRSRYYFLTGNSKGNLWYDIGWGDDRWCPLAWQVAKNVHIKDGLEYLGETCPEDISAPKNGTYHLIQGEVVVKPHKTDKLTTDTIRPLVAAEALASIDKIRAGYVDGLMDGPVDKLGVAKHWKRYGKHVESDGRIERIFDHELFDSTLRAYVTSDPTDTKIEKISIETE